MNIEIACRHPFRRWQVRLAETLQARGHAVSFSVRAGRDLSFATRAALVLQQRLMGPRPSLFDACPGARTSARCSDADLVIALDGIVVGGRRVLEPIFCGNPGEAALLAMLVRDDPREIRLRLRTEAQSVDLVIACPAVEDLATLSRSLNQILARLISLVVQGVESIDRGSGGHPTTELASTDLAGAAPARHIVSGLARKVAARLSKESGRPDYWRTAHRLAKEPHAQPSTDKVDRPFVILPDDGTRFYADPFPFEHKGRTCMFVEDYPYATGKGVIAFVEIDAAGRASTPRVVLEQECHLSYPFVTRHKGEIYMLPETSGARCVQLFRADPFPDRWVPDRILLDDVVAADATPIEHEGRWWMFATLSDDGGSSWDQLGLFHAPDLLGSWTPHADNPVLVDAGAARPAGAMWHEGGVLMRVAQDCRDGYGAGLAICRVDRLDEAGFAQTVLRRIAAPDGYGADGIHTLNRAGHLEVIDLRFAAGARSGGLSRDRAAPL